MSQEGTLGYSFVLFLLHLLSKIHSQLFSAMLYVWETHLCGLTHWIPCQMAVSWTPLTESNRSEVGGEDGLFLICPLQAHLPAMKKARSSHHWNFFWRTPFKVPSLPELPHSTIPSPVPKSANSFQPFLVFGCLNILTWFLSPVSTSAYVPYIKVCLSASPGVQAASWQCLTAGEA